MSFFHGGRPTVGFKMGRGKWRQNRLRWAELSYIGHRTHEAHSEEELHNAQKFL
jgi:hypothetical protein